MDPLVWSAAFATLWSAGYLLASALRIRPADRLVALAIHLALGLSVWPVLFLWTTVAGIGWTPVAMRLAVLLAIVAALLVLARRVVARPPRWSRLRPALPWLATLVLLAVLTVIGRLAHIRDLSFPPWVDGVHHGMIVRLLLEQGRVPATADPFIAGASFFYHWGFHVPVAFIAALTGRTSPPDGPGLLLQYGQFLNALTLITMYAGGRVLLRSREGGMFAAVLAVFVSYFPAFYLSWGRYTHLAGTLVMPPLLIALWMTARKPRPWRWGAVAVLLAAGVVLIHVRVALFALVFSTVLLIAARRSLPRTLLRWSVAALLVIGIIGPWLVTLAREPHVAGVAEPSRQTELPMHLIGATHNRELLAIATAGLSGMAGWLEMPRVGRALSVLWWLLLIIVSRVEPRSAHARRRMPWAVLALIGLWVAVIAVALYWRPRGIDLTGIASLDSAVITMFMPLAIAGAALITWALSRLVTRRHAAVVACAVAVAIAGAGASFTTDVVNPITIFTTRADLRAMRWIERNVPPGAVFAVDSRPWLHPAWVGVDGGYWISVATGRRSIVPPLLYGWALPPAEVERINAVLTTWSHAPLSDTTWDVLRRAGVTHIYIGPRGVEWKRDVLLASDRVRVIHRDAGVAVFEIVR